MFDNKAVSNSTLNFAIQQIKEWFVPNKGEPVIEGNLQVDGKISANSMIIYGSPVQTDRTIETRFGKVFNSTTINQSSISYSDTGTSRFKDVQWLRIQIRLGESNHTIFLDVPVKQTEATSGRSSIYLLYDKNYSLIWNNAVVQGLKAEEKYLSISWSALNDGEEWNYSVSFRLVDADGNPIEDDIIVSIEGL